MTAPTMVPAQSDEGGQIVVTGNHHTTIPEASQHFGRIKTKNTG